LNSLVSGDKLAGMLRRARKMFLICVASTALGDAGFAQVQPVSPLPQRPANSAPLNSNSPLLEAAPGIPLPPYGTVWILDSGETKSRLVRMRPSDALPDKHIAKNMARNEILILKNVSTLDLAGAASDLRLSGRPAAIFVRRAGPATQQVQPLGGGIVVPSHFVLLRTRQLDDRRELCSFTFWKLGGKRARHEDDVEISTEEIGGGRWLKLTPKQPVLDGEYAVVDMPEDPTQANASAYDFGVGPIIVKPEKHP
jgi:hypothetical protein